MLRILGYNVSLHVVNSNDIRLARHMGTMTPGQQWIAVEDTLVPEQIESTIVHEIIEFGGSQLGLGLSESQIQGVETTVVSALREAGVPLSALLNHIDA